MTMQPPEHFDPMAVSDEKKEIDELETDRRGRTGEYVHIDKAIASGMAQNVDDFMVCHLALLGQGMS